MVVVGAKADLVTDQGLLREYETQAKNWCAKHDKATYASTRFLLFVCHRATCVTLCLMQEAAMCRHASPY